jgi:hypothetical protein
MEMPSYWIVLRSYSVGCRSYRRPNSVEKFILWCFGRRKRRLVNRHWFIEPCQTIFNRTSQFVKDKLLQLSQLGRETSLADLRWGIGGEQTRYCNLSTRIRFRQLDMPPCMGLSNVSSISFIVRIMYSTYWAHRVYIVEASQMRIWFLFNWTTRIKKVEERK